MIVDSGPFVTAGAALGHLDLALWLVRRVSPQLASLTAQYLNSDMVDIVTFSIIGILLSSMVFQSRKIARFIRIPGRAAVVAGVPPAKLHHDCSRHGCLYSYCFRSRFDSGHSIFC